MCVCGFRPIDFDETAHRRANPLSIDVQPQTEARRASTAEARTTTNRPEQEPGGLPFFVDRKKQKHWQTKHQTNKRPQPVHTHTRNYLLVFPLLFASGSKTDKKEGREGRSQVTRPNLKGLNKHSQTPAYTHTHTFDRDYAIDCSPCAPTIIAVVVVGLETIKPATEASRAVDAEHSFFCPDQVFVARVLHRNAHWRSTCFVDSREQQQRCCCQ